jgi:hypothetical protein
MDEFFSPPLILAGCGTVTVLFGATIVYLEGLFGGDA